MVAWLNSASSSIRTEVSSHGRISDPFYANSFFSKIRRFFSKAGLPEDKAKEIVPVEPKEQGNGPLAGLRTIFSSLSMLGQRNQR